MASLETILPDAIDRLDGPALIALWGSDDPAEAFRLGTREYDWHSHFRGQLFCIDSGLIHLRTQHGSWLLPPHRVGWIPPGERHKASVSGALSGWSVLIMPDASRGLPDKPCVVGTNELLRALVRRAASWADQDHLSPEEDRLVAVLMDEIRRAPQEPLHLPMPTDERLARIATALISRPDDPRTLDQWAQWAGLSARTLRRAFQAQTGTSFAQWRQQARLTRALELLARGDAVATVADALGYASPSNFIAMFRRSFGASPARYFASRPRSSSGP
ncbi:MAG: helix-turn-helix transcriptional regulator [Pseudomonadota bacterium]